MLTAVTQVYNHEHSQSYHFLPEIARLIDISAVRADSTRQDVEDIIDGAIKHNFICVFPMPGMLPLVFEKLKDHPQIGIGGVVGFPSGGETTASKLFQAKELKEAGCNEIDMVLNIGKLKSGMLNDIEDEIRRSAAVSSSFKSNHGSRPPHR